MQCETQVVAGRLDLVLGLQVGHGVCVDTINSHHHVTLAKLRLGGLAAWSDLGRETQNSGHKEGRQFP